MELEIEATCGLNLLPVTTCNTVFTGIVLSQVEKLQPAPTPVITVANIPWVFLYLWYTLGEIEWHTVGVVV